MAATGPSTQPSPAEGRSRPRGARLPAAAGPSTWHSPTGGRSRPGGVHSSATASPERHASCAAASKYHHQLWPTCQRGAPPWGPLE
eukprot:9931621-Alexandrium_andersonii.AAC.1